MVISKPDNSLTIATNALLEVLDNELVLAAINSDRKAAKRVFQGFRQKARMLDTPPVRDRLIEELKNSTVLQEALSDLWRHPHSQILRTIKKMTIKNVLESLDSLAAEHGAQNVQIALYMDGRKRLREATETVKTQSRPKAPSPKKTEARPSAELAAARQRIETLAHTVSELKKAKREALRIAKLADARSKTAKRRIENAQAKTRETLALLEEEAKEHKQTRKDNTRLTRKVSVLEKKLDDSEKTANNLRAHLDAARKNTPVTKRLSAPKADWPRAVEELISHKNHQQAEMFLTALVECSPDEPRVHELLELVYKGLGKEEAIGEVMWLAKHSLDSTDFHSAASYTCKAILTSKDTEEPLCFLLEILGRCSPRNEKRVSDLRIALLELQKADADTYQQVILMARAKYPELAHRLEGPATAAATDKPYEFTWNQESVFITPRDLVAAVDQNDLETVEIVYNCLREAFNGAQEQREEILNGISELDASVASLLTGPSLAPVVVDTSNVAHHARKENDKPKLSNLLRMRKHLHAQGYFPVFLCADCALPHQIDKGSDLQGMVDAGEVELAEAHTDADPWIIERAQNHACSIVTNDGLREWPVDEDIRLIKYRIDETRVVLDPAF